MAKKEVKTDYWVNSLLKEADLNLEPQGSSIKEINEALKTASKSRTGKVGFPEFVGIVKESAFVHIHIQQFFVLCCNQGDGGVPGDVRAGHDHTDKRV